MANKRFIDFPIATTVGDNDIILIWQGGANKQTTKATILSGVPDSLNDLTDVTISGLTNGQILRYDSVTGQWENTDQGNLDLNDLNDVTIVSPTNGQVLVYNSTTSKWENSSGGYVPYVGAVTTVNLGAQTIQAGSFVKQSGTSSQFLKADGSVDSTAYGTGSVTSVGLTMPSAFNVANSPITTSGTLAVTGAGTVGQYIRGDGSLADFPQSSGGGSSVSYYLNGSVDQGTIGGIAYKELSKVPILGAGTDFTINADGYIASFITDAGDPSLLEIPGGNWNFETYFSASSSGGTPTFYVELYKVSGTTATLIASSSSAPELIAFGTNLTPYFSTLAVPTTTLALTDRLAVRYYVTHSGRTITLHTENNHLCQIITTFTTGLTALNGLTAQVQNFAVGTTGTDFNIASATATHTFNLPTASATNRGALSTADWSLFTQAYNDKINSAAVTGTTTKTLTLTQQDGGTITASWSDLNTDAVLSVFGRTGAVVAANGDYTTAQVTESGNLYYTDARSRAALSFAAGSGAYNTSTGVITIPTNNNQITNGAGYITSAALAGYLPLTGGTLTGPLGGTSASFSGIIRSNETSGFAIGDIALYRRIQYDLANTRFSFLTDGNAFANVGAAAANFSSSVTASSFIRSGGTSSQFLKADGSVDSTTYVPTSRTITINGTSQDLSANCTFNVGTVTSVTASSPLASSGGTTPNITIQQASGSQSGFLSSTDWTTFNNKQNALTNPVTGTGTTNYLPKFTGSTTIGNSALYDGGGFGGFNSTGLAARTFVINAASGRPLALELIENANVHAIFFRPNNSGYNLISSNYISGGVYLPLSLSARENNADLVLATSGNLLVGTVSDNGARVQVSGAGVAFNFTTSNGLIGNINSSAANGGYVTWQTSGTTIADLGTAQQVFGAGGNDTFGINARGARSLILGTNNTGRLTIDSTGAATFSSSVNVGGVSSNTDFRIYRTVAPSVFFSISAPGGTPNTSTLGVNGTDVMVLNASGNVGIGTLSPTHKLQVLGSSDSGIRLTDSSGNTRALLNPSGVQHGEFTLFNNSGNATTYLGGGGGSNYVMAQGGNFLIGTQTDSGGRLQVNGIIRSNDTYGFAIGAIASYRRIQYGSDNATSFTLLTDGNGYAGLYAGTANFSSSVTATSFFESSDASLKTLIADNYQAKGINSVVAKLYIKNGKEELGYFAQDLQGVLPSAVSKGSDGLLNLSYREVHTAKIAYLEEEIRQIKKRYEIN